MRQGIVSPSYSGPTAIPLSWKQKETENPFIIQIRSEIIITSENKLVTSFMHPEFITNARTKQVYRIMKQGNETDRNSYSCQICTALEQKKDANNLLCNRRKRRKLELNMEMVC